MNVHASTYSSYGLKLSGDLALALSQPYIHSCSYQQAEWQSLILVHLICTTNRVFPPILVTSFMNSIIDTALPPSGRAFARLCEYIPRRRYVISHGLYK